MRCYKELFVECDVQMSRKLHCGVFSFLTSSGRDQNCPLRIGGRRGVQVSLSLVETSRALRPVYSGERADISPRIPTPICYTDVFWSF